VSNDGNSIGGGEDLRKNGGRIILFILGGVTFSETRSAYEIMKELRRDVVIGKESFYYYYYYYYFFFFFLFVFG